MLRRWQVSLKPVHGGPDGGPEPLWDFSTNANALGPNPVILEYLKKADPSRYPDPHYRKVRQALAEAHGVAPEQVAVGTGTSELVHRLVRWLGGPVLVLSPTFSEYARAALAHKVPLWEARSPEDFLNRLPQSRLAFLCVPNNPTGEVFPFLEEAANRAGGALVLDLAYYPLMENPPRLPQKAFWLYSPNKAHGLTGVRAGYLVGPVDITPFQHLAPSWPVSVHGEALLLGHLDPGAQTWLAESKWELFRLRRLLAQGLRGLGLEVRESPANFLLVRVGRAKEVALALRERGLRVRDCTSFGLREWLRLSAQKEEAIRALLAALEEVLVDLGRGA
ncbi:aspartate aminotransferase [Thermus scotoductus]|uniref:histidinol-phosphate transaminase n=1 Tax=Thermus scotoductus TaxID=37636 RepID=A0A430V540_THESC|nr:aspartate aminotransferase [Thermus scotoductus]RTH04057.1 aspartate aminotransferase [Thermus scotoductus]RTH19131.1 aspartate aminotransferase [Thermus scotoductus]RTI02244.1 aspartate aminotransferase [Thermus scotoductus]RTI09621.1 aspartate aminotransferase [Thermus scotoductus]